MPLRTFLDYGTLLYRRRAVVALTALSAALTAAVVSFTLPPVDHAQRARERQQGAHRLPEECLDRRRAARGRADHRPPRRDGGGARAGAGAALQGREPDHLREAAPAGGPGGRVRGRARRAPGRG